jgi:hypothetical protein
LIEATPGTGVCRLKAFARSVLVHVPLIRRAEFRGPTSVSSELATCVAPSLRKSYPVVSAVVGSRWPPKSMNWSIWNWICAGVSTSRPSAT